MKEIKILIILLLFLLYVSGNLYSQGSSICSICKSKIEGQYYEYKQADGSKIIVCAKCNYNSPKCEICEIPLRATEKYKGYNICSQCRKTAKFCSICGDLIKDTFYKTDSPEHYFCDSCYKKNPKCALCSKPVSPPSDWDGKSKLLCVSCKDKALYCSRCGALILKKYNKVEKTNEIFCEKCLKDAPKCDRCKKTLSSNEGIKVRDKIICNLCEKESEKCSLCNNPIIGEFYKFKYAEGKFCDWCIKHNPACSMCGRPIGGEIFLFPDGRKLCDECHKEVVFDAKEINIIHKEIVSIFKEDLDISLKSVPPIKIVDVDALNKIMDKNSKSKEITELGLFHVNNGDRTIYILQGLPKPYLYETLAHETAHCFQYEINPKLEDKKVIEGFAQWAASKILLRKGFYPALDKLMEREDIYGKGFREIQGWEQKHGKLYILGQIKQAK